MKRSLLGIASGFAPLTVLALALASGCSTVGGLFGATPAQTNNNQFFVNGCATYTPQSTPLNGGECIDTVTGVQYTWNATAAAFVAPGRMATAVGGTTAPTSGTGSVTAGSTDSVMEVTGATSPATVTFGTAYTNKPFCLCDDETSATGVCKVVPNANGATAVVTTASTDSFVLLCVANAK